LFAPLGAEAGKVVMLGFVWNLNPVLIELGPITIRYYGVVFVCTLVMAYIFWRWQMRRGGYSREIIEGFITWGTVATIVGARLGHCLFYEPARYLNDPIEILYFWQGGLASHGATIGLVLALVLYARRHKLPLLELMDRFAPSAAVGAAGIRLGNFLNSEIVGRATNVPWAVRFMRYSDHGAIARHPSQLYEFAMGLLVLLAIVLADRWAGREKRPRGLLVSLFLLLYFTGRFCVEFAKEYQVPELESLLTMGQWLSIIPTVIGAALLVWCIARPVPTRLDVPAAPLPAMPAPTPNKPNRARLGRRKRNH
jgi:prolipoprotein diacylglyceryl transferase